MRYDPHRRNRRSIRLPGYNYARPGAYFVTICTHGRQPLFGALHADAMLCNTSETHCATRHENFGALHADAMLCNAAGRMVEHWWQTLNEKFPSMHTDAWVVMPDHFHGIVVIGHGGVNNDDDGGVNPRVRPPRHHDDGGVNPRVRPSRHHDDGGVNPRVRPPRHEDAGDDRDAGGYASPPLHGETDDSGDDGAGVVTLPRIMQWFKTMTTNAYIRGVKQSGWPPFERRVWQRGYWERIVRDDDALQAIRRYIAENPRRHAERLDALLARMQRKDTR